MRGRVGGVDHSRHSCKKNHFDSSGAMETSILCKLQVAVTKGGARLKVCISDGDVKLGEALRSIDDNELADVQRVLDLNHLVRNFGKALTALKAKHWRKSASLTERNIQLLCTMFTRIVHHHRVESSSMTMPLDLQHTANESVNEVDGYNDDSNIDDNDDVINSLRDLTPLMKASLREDKLSQELVKEGDVEEVHDPCNTPSSMYDGNAVRNLFKDFEEVDVVVNLSDDIAELVTQGSPYLVNTQFVQFLVAIVVGTHDRHKQFKISDHFKTDEECDDEEEVIDDNSADGFAFHVSRERVTKLRDNLVNMLPHYFNRHDGTSILIIIRIQFYRQ